MEYWCLTKIYLGDVDNEPNIDPDKPWLAIVEADGDLDLRYEANEGEGSDLFKNGICLIMKE